MSAILWVLGSGVAVFLWLLGTAYCAVDVLEIEGVGDGFEVAFIFWPIIVPIYWLTRIPWRRILKVLGAGV